MKKLIMLFLCCVLIIIGCDEKKENIVNKSDKNDIEGYWMTESGETLSFDSKGQAISDGVTMDYSVYGENNLSISLWGTASEYRYIVEKDVLTLVDLNENTTSVYYRNVEKQSEIQKKLKEAQEEKERQERVALEKKQREEDIILLENEILEIDNEISELNKNIDKYYNEISDLEKEIPEITNKIAEFEKELEQLVRENEGMEETVYNEISRLRRGELRQYIENHEFTLRSKNWQLKELKGEHNKTRIAQYEENIKNLEIEKKEILEEIETLRAY